MRSREQHRATREGGLFLGRHNPLPGFAVRLFTKRDVVISERGFFEGSGRGEGSLKIGSSPLAGIRFGPDSVVAME